MEFYLVAFASMTMPLCLMWSIEDAKEYRRKLRSLFMTRTQKWIWRASLVFNLMVGVTVYTALVIGQLAILNIGDK